MMIKALIFFFALALSIQGFGEQVTANSELKLDTFIPDGCSGFPNELVTPDGKPDFDGIAEWRHCCIVHDIAYWRGGSKKSRKQADDIFFQCLSDIPKKDKLLPLQEWLYWAGVRLGGGPVVRVPKLEESDETLLKIKLGFEEISMDFSWGFGWQQLTKEGPSVFEEDYILGNRCLKKGEHEMVFNNLFEFYWNLTMDRQAYRRSWDLTEEQMEYVINGALIELKKAEERICEED